MSKPLPTNQKKKSYTKKKPQQTLSSVIDQFPQISLLPSKKKKKKITAKNKIRHFPISYRIYIQLPLTHKKIK